jgi:hypothetical protein
MPTKPDYSACSKADIYRLQKENHQASKLLIRQVKALVNRRLAYEMSFEDFTTSKNASNELIAMLHSHHDALQTALNRLRSANGQRKCRRLLIPLDCKPHRRSPVHHGTNHQRRVIFLERRPILDMDLASMRHWRARAISVSAPAAMPSASLPNLLWCWRRPAVCRFLHAGKAKQFVGLPPSTGERAARFRAANAGGALSRRADGAGE